MEREPRGPNTHSKARLKIKAATRREPSTSLGKGIARQPMHNTWVQERARRSQIGAHLKKLQTLHRALRRKETVHSTNNATTSECRSRAYRSQRTSKAGSIYPGAAHDA